jgi:hypothetical protein
MIHLKIPIGYFAEIDKKIHMETQIAKIILRKIKDRQLILSNLKTR